SLQTLELLAVVRVLASMNRPLNIVTDSFYVAGVVNRIEGALIKEVQNKRLFQLFCQLWLAVTNRDHEYAIIHVCSHKWDIGLGEGNARADRLVSMATKDEEEFIKAQKNHEQYHQNARGLKRMYDITLNDAKNIVRSCATCSNHNSGVGLGMGVNSRGLKSNEIWQMDVTHYAPFGRFKYIHVCIDTYSHFIWATAQTGEKALQVERHLCECFAVMGKPQQIKTDNGPAYMGTRVGQFLKKWKVVHRTGIAHSPTGQAIIERAHYTLKTYLEK
ncbi:hypothetical protein N305_04483, partial [Manacus vitellinus]